MSENNSLHIAKPFVPDVLQCMHHFNVVMRLLVTNEQTTADLYLASIKTDHGEKVYATVMRMIEAAHDG
ncbi:hypothetical protein [Umezawaea tangerina]|uniref:Uncharacterized protein n=1 Tax=Umezawaea tangerina TaxID=84725 RepID=A0A2T0SPQ6_9PSEU|nr:hypothetical protein [Umezawaea tangerina]PRY35394.1 hypothetical protein CLV43_114312 [Umezawaea tangerina]